MKLSATNLILLLFLLLASALEFAQRYVDFTFFQFWVLGTGMLVITGVSYRMKKEIAPTLAFFALVHFTRYANEYVVAVLDSNFNGTYFLLPVALFTLIIILIKPGKETIGWWKMDKVSGALILQMSVVLVVGSIGMYWFMATHQDELDRFLEMLPQGSILKIVSLGLVFAGMNAAVEEFVIRGMIWNGLGKIMSNTTLLIVVQAIIFGLSHYFGLPGGITGVVMVFGWSLFIGYFRWKSGGLLAAIGLHFSANLAQFFMLYLF